MKSEQPCDANPVPPAQKSIKIRSLNVRLARMGEGRGGAQGSGGET